MCIPKEVFSYGDRVSHGIFGYGTVMSAMNVGNDTMLTIQFNKVGLKKLMANYANLQKI